jgi:hypothetical protein
MADPMALAGPTNATNQRTLELIEHHDPERAARMRGLTPNGTPPHAAQQWELAAWNAEVLAFIVEQVAPIPKRRGRPRKKDTAA